MPNMLFLVAPECGRGFRRPLLIADWASDWFRERQAPIDHFRSKRDGSLERAHIVPFRGSSPLRASPKPAERAADELPFPQLCNTKHAVIRRGRLWTPSNPCMK